MSFAVSQSVRWKLSDDGSEAAWVQRARHAVFSCWCCKFISALLMLSYFQMCQLFGLWNYKLLWVIEKFVKHVFRIVSMLLPALLRLPDNYACFKCFVKITFVWLIVILFSVCYINHVSHRLHVTFTLRYDMVSHRLRVTFIVNEKSMFTQIIFMCCIFYLCLLLFDVVIVIYVCSYTNIVHDLLLKRRLYYCAFNHSRAQMFLFVSWWGLRYS